MPLSCKNQEHMEIYKCIIRIWFHISNIQSNYKIDKNCHCRIEIVHILVRRPNWLFDIETEEKVFRSAYQKCQNKIKKKINKKYFSSVRAHIFFICTFAWIHPCKDVNSIDSTYIQKKFMKNFLLEEFFFLHFWSDGKYYNRKSVSDTSFTST